MYFKSCKYCFLRSRFPTTCRSLSRVVGSVVSDHPRQPTVCLGAMYSNMAICTGDSCVIRIIWLNRPNALICLDGRQAHWAALACFIKSIAGNLPRIYDANYLSQPTSVKCIKPSPLCWCQPPRTHAVREYPCCT